MGQLDTSRSALTQRHCDHGLIPDPAEAASERGFYVQQ
jgi:hypothetical protein